MVLHIQLDILYVLLCPVTEAWELGDLKDLVVGYLFGFGLYWSGKIRYNADRLLMIFSKLTLSTVIKVDSVLHIIVAVLLVLVVKAISPNAYPAYIFLITSNFRFSSLIFYRTRGSTSFIKWWSLFNLVWPEPSWFFRFLDSLSSSSLSLDFGSSTKTSPLRMM